MLENARGTGNDVDVTVLSVKGNQVRLGVKAPKEVTVHREEIYDRICQEQQNGHMDGFKLAT